MRQETLPIYREIDERLKTAHRVLVVTHQNPDGDGLGAGLAIVHYLRDLAQPYLYFCADKRPFFFSFLPGIKELQHDPSLVRREDFDLLLAVDSGDLGYTGIETVLPAPLTRHQIINIDHHQTNTYFGAINLIDVTASSTSEIVFRFFDQLRLPITPAIATCLLTGIITDTGGFSNPATSTSSLAAASRLLIAGARFREITTHTLQNKSLAALKLWGRLFARLKLDKKTGFVSTVITQKDMEECQVDEEATEGVANFLNNLAGTRAVIVLRELPAGLIKGSLRTTNQDVDVAQIASLFGGGGHKKAAGFTIKGKLVETAAGWQVR